MSNKYADLKDDKTISEKRKPKVFDRLFEHSKIKQELQSLREDDQTALKSKMAKGLQSTFKSKQATLILKESLNQDLKNLLSKEQLSKSGS